MEGSNSVIEESQLAELENDARNARSKSDAAPRPSIWGTSSSAFGKMKDRAALARHSLTPQLQLMKQKTSKRLEKYQPQLDRVKSSASAAASTGLQRMQPALSKARVGSNKGWSMLKTKLAAAAPVAENFKSISINVMTDLITDSTVDGVEWVEDPQVAACAFLEEYKWSPKGKSALAKSNSMDETKDEGLSRAQQCLSNPYILGNILIFTGSVQTLGYVSCVNRSCHGFIKSEKRLWRFCVRFGSLPQRLRFGFWEHIVSAETLKKNSELDYDTYLQMALSKGESTELIQTDVKRTYGRVAPHKRSANDPNEGVEVDQELVQQLSDLLHAISGRFPEVGYCQGMDYIVAHVLDHVKKSTDEIALMKRQMEGAFVAPESSPRHKAASKRDAERAFWVLVGLFENYGLRQMFSPGLERLHLHCFQFQKLFELAFPLLYEHFDKEKVVVEMFIVGWFQTLFLYLNALPRDTLDRIWDIFILENKWKIQIRVALALMKVSVPHISDKPIDEVMQFLNTFEIPGDDLLQCDALIAEALSIKVTNSVLHKLQRQHAKSRKKKNST